MSPDIILPIVGLLFAGLVKGISGFAFGLFAVGLLVSFYSPKIVIPSLVLIYLITNTILLYEHRRIVTRSFLRQNPIFSPCALSSAFIGLPLGAVVLRHASVWQVSLCVGILLSLTALYYLSQEFRDHTASDRGTADIMAGGGKLLCCILTFLSGLLEGFLGIAGPPLMIFMLMKRYDRHLFITSFSLLDLLLSPFRLVIYLFMGLYNSEVVELFGFVLIFVLIGLAVGMFVRRKWLSEGLFRKITIVLLLAIGINLVAKNL